MKQLIINHLLLNLDFPSWYFLLNRIYINSHQLTAGGFLLGKICNGITMKKSLYELHHNSTKQRIEKSGKVIGCNTDDIHSIPIFIGINNNTMKYRVGRYKSSDNFA